MAGNAAALGAAPGRRHPFGDPLFRLLCVLGAVASLMAFGVLGVGHGGPASTNLDARVLYVAGSYWQHGISAYRPGLPIQIEPELMEIVDRYEFGYPPHIAPLSLFLAAVPWELARQLVTALNVAAALTLATLCAGRAGEAGAGERARWMIAALVIGNLSTAYVVWAGQTTLLVAAALLGAWYCAHNRRPVLGGILLAVAALKPQLIAAAVLWLMLERQWRVVAVAGISVLVLGFVPLVIDGPLDLLKKWYEAISVYQASGYNNFGSRMVVGLPSMLKALGVAVPHLGPPLLLLFTCLLWRFRARVLAEDVLPLLIGFCLLFGFAHGYDLAVLAPFVPAFWRHVRGRPFASAAALGLFTVVTMPNSIFEPLGMPLLLHARVLALLLGVIWLWAMSVKKTGELRRGRVGMTAAA